MNTEIDVSEPVIDMRRLIGEVEVLIRTPGTHALETMQKLVLIQGAANTALRAAKNSYTNGVGYRTFPALTQPLSK